MESSDDAGDWALACQGHDRAFQRVFNRHYDRLMQHCQRLADLPSDAEDMVALTFLEAWRKRTTVRLVHGSVLPWLIVTATNVGRNYNRARRRYRDFLASLPHEEMVEDPFVAVENEGIRSAIRRLSGNDRHVLTLCVIEGFSEAEASVALGVPAGTVKSRLHRAKARLAQLVDERNAELATSTKGFL